MTPELAKQFRSLLVKTSVIQIVSVFLLFLIPIAASNATYDDLAEVVASSVRRDIVVGSHRDVITKLGEHTPEKFSSIDYISNDKIYLLPVGSKQSAFDKFFEREHEIKIELSGGQGNGEVVGTLIFRRSQLATILTPLIIAILIIAASYPLYKRAKKKLSLRYDHDLRSRRESVIAKTTQMVAHDVRKPYSKLISTLNLISSCTTIEEAQSFSQKMLPQIANDLNTVNTRLKDIMDINTKVDLVFEETSPCSLIELALNNIFRADEKSNVVFEYDLNHTWNALVSSDKMLRVFENIIRNAVEATHGQTTLTFSTYVVKIKRKHFIKFEIKNTGSHIKASNVNAVFNDDFSQNKTNGTGLGLAIAQKFVESHGGAIECESSEEENWVEFSFTVPAGKVKSEYDRTQLPLSSDQIHQKWAQETLRSETRHPSTDLSGLERTFRSLIDSEQECRILIVDDEVIYRKSLEHQLSKNPEVSKYLKITSTSNFTMAVGAAVKLKPHLVICDIDLGANSKNGFEAVRRIRNLGIRSHICMHSSRAREDAIDETIEAGADEFLPKPMSYEHLLGHLVIALTKASIIEEKAPREITVVDDDESFLFLWKNTVKDAKVNTFSSPEKFLERLETDPTFLARQQAVVTDYYFDGQGSMNGTEFASRLKETFGREAILCSDHSELHPEDRRAFLWVISKQPVGLRRLKEVMEFRGTHVS